jgi:hypothetical protein
VIQTHANRSLADLESELELMRKQSDEKDAIISQLRNEADMNAQKILFLSHYATQMRVESTQTSRTLKRRLSDLSEKERNLYRRVSDACNRIVVSKVDTEQDLANELRSKFDLVQTQMEESVREMSERYKSEILELKSKLLGSD